MSAELTGELKTILEVAAFAPLSDRAFLRITGPDAPRWLNGMVTNSIQSLEPGRGNYNFLLNAQGRIVGDCTVYREHTPTEPTYLLETDKSQIDTIHQLLDRFIIMDDVELASTDYPESLLLLGRNLERVVPLVGDSVAPETLEPLRLYNFFSAPAYTPAPGLIPQLRLAFTSGADLGAAAQALTSAGVIQVSPASLEVLRILEARPRYGTDIRNSDTAKDLPQETNQTHALHFAKGCYLGQEIVERIRSRGQVHRQFTPFRLEGPPPTSFPVALEAKGKPAGELTSAVAVPTTEGDLWLALGYGRREFLDGGIPFTYADGTAYPRTPGRFT